MAPKDTKPAVTTAAKPVATKASSVSQKQTAIQPAAVLEPVLFDTRADFGAIVEKYGFTRGAELGVQRGHFAHHTRLALRIAFGSGQVEILVMNWKADSAETAENDQIEQDTEATSHALVSCGLTPLHYIAGSSSLANTRPSGHPRHVTH